MATKPTKKGGAKGAGAAKTAVKRASGAKRGSAAKLAAKRATATKAKRATAANTASKRATAPKTAAKRAPAAKRAAASKRATSAPRKGARAASWAPEGVGAVTPNLVFRDSLQAIAFYKEAFGAEQVSLMMAPDGKGVWHAEIRIGGSTIFLNDESPMSTLRAPSPQHAPTASIQLFVPDCDAVIGRAMNHGAMVSMPPSDMFWGDRMGMLTDPFGQVWAVSTRVKHLSPEEMRRAGEEFVKQMAQHSPPPTPAPPTEPTQPRAQA